MEYTTPGEAAGSEKSGALGGPDLHLVESRPGARVHCALSETLGRSSIRADHQGRCAGGEYRPSGEEGLDHVTVDVGQAPVDPVVPEREPFVVDPQEVQHRGV